MRNKRRSRVGTQSSQYSPRSGLYHILINRGSFGSPTKENDNYELSTIQCSPFFRGLCLDTRIYETREEAEAERNRLNTAYGLDKIGI